MAYDVKPQDYWRIADEEPSNEKNNYNPNGSESRTFRQAISHGNRLSRNANVSDIENRLSANRDVYGRDNCLKKDPVAEYFSLGFSGDAELGRQILIEQMRNRQMNEETYSFFKSRLREDEELDSGWDFSSGTYTPNPRKEEIKKEIKNYLSLIGREARLEQEQNKKQRMAERREE